MTAAPDHLYGSDASPDRQRAALTGGSIPVAVYGLGKMGLPLAGVYAETTGNVVGVDVDPAVVEAVEGGESHVTGEPGLADLVAEQVGRGRFRATTDGAAAAAEAAIHVVIVPTLVEEDEPDLSLIEAVARDVGSGLEAGDLVIVESTVPPGTCRDEVRPVLASESGLAPNEFGLAFCPERTASGTALRDIRGQYPKVVGGVDDESTRAAALVYDQITDNEVQVVSDATTAESVKVFEGVYRDVNIGLANELARIAGDLGISVREAIDTANAIPQCDLHDPGPGVGGHCIPFYPYFLLDRVPSRLPITRTARTVNEEMPAFTVAQVEQELRRDGVRLEDASVLVLGLTYRPGVAETRASPGVAIVEELAELGATVYACDPLVDVEQFGAQSVPLAALTDPGGGAPPSNSDGTSTATAVPTLTLDAAVLVTPQDGFDAIAWEALEPMPIVDGRDVLSLSGTDHRVVTLGGSADGGSSPERREAPPAKRPDGGAVSPRDGSGDGHDGGEFDV